LASAPHAAGLIDTDILIDAARGVQEAKAFLASQRQAYGAQISIVSAMELVVGSRDKAELKQLQQFLQSVVVLPVNEAASQQAYQLMETFSLSHGLLIPDALIAATALEQSLPRYTKNLRHYQMIPALSVIRPY
jgi:predicted nucleic acid-binding protein